jgi:hypothetical protein
MNGGLGVPPLRCAIALPTLQFTHPTLANALSSYINWCVSNEKKIWFKSPTTRAGYMAIMVLEYQGLYKSCVPLIL